MTTFLAIGGWILGACAFAAFLWFGVKPWISPLYQRYLAFVQNKASGK